MSKKYSLLKQIPNNKSVVVYTPFEGNDVLVRTGTVNDDNCFLHALLHACSKEYVSSSDGDRIKFKNKICKELVKLSDIEKRHMQDSDFIRDLFKENIVKVASRFYENLAAKKSDSILDQLDKGAELYLLISELVGVNVLTDIVNIAYKKVEFVDEFFKILMKYVKKTRELSTVKPEKAKYIIHNAGKMFTVIINETLNIAFKKYIPPIGLDESSIELVSNHFNRDIYFIDAKNRMPYSSTYFIDSLKGRKSIIILRIHNTHYEIIGRLKSGNIIQREFDSSDILIQKLSTFIKNPENVARKYKDLIEFLPAKYQTIELSDSESEDEQVNRSPEGSEINESDHESDSEHMSENEAQSESESKHMSENEPDSESEHIKHMSENETESESESEHDYENKETDGTSLPDKFVYRKH